MKNTLEIGFERKEIVILFMSIILLSFGITMMVGIFGMLYTICHIVNRITTYHEYVKSPNVNFVN